jgi:tryptophan-rich sensory protein
MKKNISSFWKLVICIVICEATGIVSSLFASAANNTWFNSLAKPEWNPPSYLFAPVWTSLYLLMGISLWIIWKNEASETTKQKAYYLFAFQLFLNFWWSIIFFKFHSPLVALIDIILMLIIILLTIIHFSKFSKLAAWLLVPYISWVSFATLLNYSIWYLNK